MTRRHHDYLDYLMSPEWGTQRRRTLRHAGYRCECCGGPGPLDAHHLTYARLGYELDGDTAAVCPACHIDAHSPRNRAMRVREAHGQGRLFDR